MLISPYPPLLGGATETMTQSQLASALSANVPKLASGQPTVTDAEIGEIVSQVYGKGYVVAKGTFPEYDSKAESEAKSAVTSAVLSVLMKSGHLQYGMAFGDAAEKAFKGWLLVPASMVAPVAAIPSVPTASSQASDTAVVAALAARKPGSTATTFANVTEALKAINEIAPMIAAGRQMQVASKVMQAQAKGQKFYPATQEKPNYWAWILAGIGVTILLGVLAYRYATPADRKP